ncbi:hypothetical protein B11Cv2_006080 [Bartonella sp. 1-1C]|nr:hypothetical protein B11Cv2_006080 [Bartonella sp. 1-1C]
MKTQEGVILENVVASVYVIFFGKTIGQKIQLIQVQH